MFKSLGILTGKTQYSELSLDELADMSKVVQDLCQDARNDKDRISAEINRLLDIRREIQQEVAKRFGQ